MTDVVWDEWRSWGFVFGRQALEAGGSGLVSSKCAQVRFAVS